MTKFMLSLMSDRWPAMMLRKTASAYLDMGEAEFERAVLKGIVPLPIRYGDRDRWSKAQIDARLEGIGGEHDWRAQQPLYADAEKRQAEHARAARAHSPKSLAERWGCSSELVRAMIRRGELQAFRYGKLYRISPEEVKRVESGKAPHP
jgi:excisionase family DNA binding protein